MSRAYRIRVKESLTRDIRAEDCIETELEILEILPEEQMGELLARELEGRGYERQEDGTLVKKGADGVTVTVEPCSGTVTIKSESADHVQVEGSREGYGYDDVGPGRKNIEERLGKELVADLEKRVEQQTERLQKTATDKLEKKLREVEPELRQAVERVTAEALKEKARTMGEVKEIHEDREAGSLTIKVEV